MPDFTMATVSTANPVPDLVFENVQDDETIHQVRIFQTGLKILSDTVFAALCHNQGTLFACVQLATYGDD